MTGVEFLSCQRGFSKIDATLRKFLWGGVDSRKVIAKVAWEESCVPKKEGGLGISNLFTCNKANMATHLWDLATGKDTLWVKWCHAYMLRGQCIWTCNWVNDASWTWQKIMKLKDSFQNYIKYRVGNGEKIFTWFDNWHGDGPLVKTFGTRIMYDAVSRPNCKLDEYIRNGQWNFHYPVSHALQRVVQNMPQLYDGEDIVEWTLTSNMEFSCASAREAIRDRRSVVEWWKVVWFRGHVPRMAFILWMAFKCKMMTKDNLKQWGCVGDDECVLCLKAVETCDHLFFDCEYAKKIWAMVLRRNGIGRAAERWAIEREKAIEEINGSNFNAVIRAISLVATVYMVWKERNSRIFQQCIHEWEYVLLKVAEIIRQATWDWKYARNYENWIICREWNLRDDKVLV